MKTLKYFNVFNGPWFNEFNDASALAMKDGKETLII
jgi:hypothetical protein